MYAIPKIKHKHKVCVICEGDEEYTYFERLTKLAVWSEIYEFKALNAHGISKIAALYTNTYQNDNYEIVLVFCDTDKNPQNHYRSLKKKINEFHGGDGRSRIADKIIIFANPCTMQIVLSHFGDVSLKSQSKKTNASEIERLTGIVNYDGHKKQIETMCGMIYQRTYLPMKERISRINKPDTESTSTNFISFTHYFESENPKWISDINSSINRHKLD